MEKEDNLEQDFRKSISIILLRFKNSALESSYQDYKFNAKKMPKWFVKLLWGLSVLLILRRVGTLIESYCFPSPMTEIQKTVEVYAIAMLTPALIIEIIAWNSRSIYRIRGFPSLLSWFFCVAHSSRYYFPKMLAVIPMSIPIYTFSSLLCSMYISTWFTGAIASVIGLSLQAYYVTGNVTEDYHKVLVILLYSWAYCAFFCASYVSELNDRYCYFKGVKDVQEKERWRNLLNRLPLGVVVTENGGIDFANKQCCRILGQESSALTLDSFECIKEATGVKTLKDFIQTAPNLDFSNQRFVYDNSCGQRMYFAIRSTTITLQGRDSTAIILQDQTSFEELKRLDEKYQRLYLASVAHDIRTPLNAILGMMEAMEQYPLMDDIKKLLRVAKDSANLLIFLTYDITDYSQIETNTISVNESVFSPEEVVKECAQLFEFNFKRKNIALMRHISADVPSRVLSDRNRYMQIVINLLSNSLKFTQSGQVNVTLSYQERENLLITSVQDTGIGIKEEDIPKLFRLFCKVNSTAELNPTGIGLGLSICKKLAQCLGGTIKVESVFGTGSKFTFSVSCNLPADHATSHTSVWNFPQAVINERDEANSSFDGSRSFSLLIRRSPMGCRCRWKQQRYEEPKWVPKQEPKQEPKAVCGCAKILIVDDNDSNIFVIQSYCVAQKVACDIARDGVEAVKLAEARAQGSCCTSYNVILMDINMPIMDGIEATRRIRSMEEEKKTSRSGIVALTAAATDHCELHTQHAKLGFNELIGKPLSRSVFRQLLTKYGVIIM